jgi:hypothetical protein
VGVRRWTKEERDKVLAECDKVQHPQARDHGWAKIIAKVADPQRIRATEPPRRM